MTTGTWRALLLAAWFATASLCAAPNAAICAQEEPQQATADTIEVDVQRGIVVACDHLRGQASEVPRIEIALGRARGRVGGPARTRQEKRKACGPSMHEHLLKPRWSWSAAAS